MSQNYDPPDLEPLPQPDKPQPDRKAEDEGETLLNARKLFRKLQDEKIEAKRDEIQQRRDFNKFLNTIRKFLISIIAILAVFLVSAAFFVLFWHYIVPDGWLFLSENRFAKLEKFLLSGSVGALLTALIRFQLPLKES